MTQNPESFARLPVVKVKEHIDGLQAKVSMVCLAATIRSLVEHYNEYRNSCFTKVWFFFTPKKKKLDFLSWVKAARQEYLDSSVLSSWDAPYFKSNDRVTYAEIISKLTRLAAHSDEYILINDTDVLLLDNAIMKSKWFDKSQEYVEEMEKDHPGLREFFKT